MKTKKRIIDILSLFIWKIGFHKHETNLVNKYYTDKRKPVNDKRYISVMVDGRQIHGGFADRLRGITSIYYFCKKNKIPFFIHYIYPFNLEDYLEPNNVEWRFKKVQGEICYNKKYSQPVCLQEWMLPHKFHKLYLLIRWYFSNKSLHIYTNSHFDYDKFSICYKDLFKPSSKLEEHINRNLKELGSEYTAIVLRFQQLLGDFKEGNFKVLNDSERLLLIKKCVEKIKELHTEGERFLVTSDSCTFLNEISKLDFVYTIPGKVTHIDYPQKNAEDTFIKSFVDFYMIANAKYIYLLKTSDMYQSGFPKTASMMYGKKIETLYF